MKRILLLVLALGYLIPSVFAQTYPTKYRPPNLNWQQLQTPHFKIVFPDGEDSVAFRTARILEHEYPEVQQLVGGELTHFPVVLNNFNDRSNGFVTSTHFRSEIEIPDIKGKSMNPQTGNWLETVVPHELVHALHYSHITGIWANTINLFSPDAARSLHGSIPQGVHEGIATYHETVGITREGGRGNYPYFYNQFNSIFNSQDRWSMGEMLGISAYSRPFDRHYIGGYEFTQWLQNSYGSDITKRTIDFFIRWPFLGYGTALRHTTGKWPGQLYSHFEQAQEKQIGRENDTSYDPLSIPYKGRELRRPLWLTNDRLLLYGSFYNASPGFYSYSLNDQTFRQITETRSVQDYNYDLSDYRSKLVFSNYRSSPLYDNTFKMDLHELDLSSGGVERLSNSLRVFAPVYHHGGLLALQTDHELSTLVSLDTTDSSISINARTRLPDTEFVSIKPNPVNSNQLAIVANRRGIQALWIVREDSIQEELSHLPAISFMKGSIFDPSWHPSGRRLLFTSDHTGTMQLYEYSLADDRINQLTDASYNAMEGSYSPGGDKLSFIVQQENERLPVVLGEAAFKNKLVPPSLWKPTSGKESVMNRSELGSNLTKTSSNWMVSPYRAGANWIPPRTIAPTVNEVSNSGTYEFGASFSSNDLLQRNAYRMNLSYVQDLLWYDFTYRYTGFFPGFRFNTYSDPSFINAEIQTDSGNNEIVTFLRQDRGASIGIPTRFVLENNVHFSSLGLRPSLKVRGTRFFELEHDGIPASDYTTILTGNIFSFFNYRLQQNIRDVQPHSGLVLYSELEHAFTSGTSTIETSDYRVDVSFARPTAWRSGIFLYTAPLKRWNQSLRVGFQGLTQTAPSFDNQSLVSGAFSEPIFGTSRHMASFDSRYTIPLVYPDKGGFLFPAYLSNVYLVGFSNTVADLENHTINEFFSSSRTVFGLGLRTRFRVSNLTFDIGVAVGYEPSRNEFNPFVGNF